MIHLPGRVLDERDHSERRTRIRRRPLTRGLRDRNIQVVGKCLVGSRRVDGAAKGARDVHECVGGFFCCPHPPITATGASAHRRIPPPLRPRAAPDLVESVAAQGGERPDGPLISVFGVMGRPAARAGARLRKEQRCWALLGDLRSGSRTAAGGSGRWRGSARSDHTSLARYSPGSTLLTGSRPAHDPVPTEFECAPGVGINGRRPRPLAVFG